jgi:hypothetical protein
MELLLVILFTPLAAWSLDRVFYRGELAEAAVEAFRVTKAAIRKSRRARRSP